MLDGEDIQQIHTPAKRGRGIGVPECGRRSLLRYQAIARTSTNPACPFHLLFRGRRQAQIDGTDIRQSIWHGDRECGSGTGAGDCPPAAAAEPGWPQYGGDQGGQRYSAATQITPANVGGLKRLELFTGAMSRHAGAHERSQFRDTPILDEGKLFVCSPFYEAIALDPGTGRELLALRSRIDDSPHIGYPEGFQMPRPGLWQGCGGQGAHLSCHADRRLIALDAATGKPVEASACMHRNGQFRQAGAAGQMQFTSMRW